MLLARWGEPAASMAATGDPAATAEVSSKASDSLLLLSSESTTTEAKVEGSAQNAVSQSLAQQQQDQQERQEKQEQHQQEDQQQQQKQQLLQGQEASRKLLRGSVHVEDVHSTDNALNLAGIKQHTYAFGKGEPVKHTWALLVKA